MSFSFRGFSWAKSRFLQTARSAAEAAVAAAEVAEAAAEGTAKYFFNQGWPSRGKGGERKRKKKSGKGRERSESVG